MKIVNFFPLCAFLDDFGNRKHMFYFIRDFYIISGHIPCYNIELVNENKYCFSFSVVGFLKHELEVVVQGSVLIVSGRNISNVIAKRYLYRGIIKCDFKYKFILMEGMKVLNVILDSGLLNIYMQYFFQKSNISESRSRFIKITGNEC